MCELENAAEIQKCPKSFVHDCTFYPQTKSEPVQHAGQNLASCEH